MEEGQGRDMQADASRRKRIVYIEQASELRNKAKSQTEICFHLTLMIFQKVMDEWNPMKTDYLDASFNNYNTGPGVGLAAHSQR